ncbi:uncharacterized protein LOC131891638 [Tigriopus californicus]|uniref:uncharacterized protein LOC131891638 n=1 Tax=Tigriopus californicus TaxID=6832 RepID=UPI0027DA7B09|nr:uncharacterized protein LOC131891638 [Tigriopus californicus]
MKWIYLLVNVFLLASSEPRQKRIFNVFNLVTFQNGPCVSQDSKNGTCYTAEQCTELNGKSSGPCAQGYGVCCVFSFGCGQQTAQNNTYFESNAPTTGDCMATVCPSSNDICQMRLDFNQFVITGPSTSSISTGTQIYGLVNALGSTLAISRASQCLTDSFSILGSSSTPIPVICGTNKGQHVYVEVEPQTCVQMMMSLGSTGIVTTLAQRRWSIKTTQYACNYPNLAPKGCTQYHFSLIGTGTVQTFNFDGGQHLASQDHTICVRRENGNCRICWTAASVSDFMTSGMSQKGYAKSSECCGYGATGAGTNFDCVQIPGALDQTMTSNLGAFTQFCGRSVGLVAASSALTVGASKTICSDRMPFQVRFLSDAFENEDEIDPTKGGPNAGAKLTYFQTNKGCRTTR